MIGVLLLATGAVAGVSAHSSFDVAVSANGYGVLALNGSHTSGAVLDRFYDHVYKVPSEGAEDVTDLMYDSYFGLRAEGESGWLTDAGSVAYEPGTNVILVDRSRGSLTVTEVIFAPMTLERPGYVHLLHVVNDSGDDVEDIAVTSLHNFHLGSDRDGDGRATEGESIWVDDGALYEQGDATGFAMSMWPVVAADTYSCDQVYNTVERGEDLDGRCGSVSAKWSANDQVGGFQWSIGTLAPGEEAWVGVAVGFGLDFDTTDVPRALDDWIAGRSAEALADDEVAWWADWQAAGVEPEELHDDEEDVYRQALAFLKMSQVREEGDPYGQLVASLPVASGGSAFQHTWNIAWVRDGAYAIRALIEAGHTDEAGAALDFLLQEGKSGIYADYVGMDYAVSVCRAYGDGTEWSDDDGTGPNIEFDDFGLYLWAFGAYVAATGDADWAAARADRALDGVADVLVALVEADGDAAGLISADSSIWERHWDGNQKHFTYTSAWAVAGLRAAADVAELLGDDRADGYRAAADTVAEAIAARLVDGDGVLAGSLEELADGAGYLDLAAVDAFNNGVLDPSGDVAAASFARWDAELAVASGNGYFRNDDEDLYDLQEWVMVDLRLAEAKRRACLTDEAEDLEDWITAQAAANLLTIPELMDPDTADYAGPAPMMGFGSGLYVLTIHNRAEADADCAGDPDTGDTGDTGADDTGGEGGGVEGGGEEGGGTDSANTGDTGDTGPPNFGYSSKTGGCGCGTGGGTGGLWVLALAGLLSSRRRRRAARGGRG